MVSWVWHCIKFAPRRLRPIRADLIVLGIPEYFPLRCERIMTAREESWKIQPWLGSYAFVRIDHAQNQDGIASQVQAVRKIRGVLGFLSDRDGRPDPVRPAQIDALRQECALFESEQSLPLSRRRKLSGLQPETPVRILKGPFENFEGVFVMSEGKGKALVSIDVFGRPTAVHLDDCDFQAINPK